MNSEHYKVTNLTGFLKIAFFLLFISVDKSGKQGKMLGQAKM